MAQSLWFQQDSQLGLLGIILNENVHFTVFD